MEKTEQEKFLEGITEQSVLEQPLTPEKGEVIEKDEESEEQKAKNRRERRLLERLQAERESNIELAATLKTIKESQSLRQETEPSEYLKRVERIYGNNSPEAQEATTILKEALQGVEEKATERALSKFREEQKQAQEELRNEEKTLDSFIDTIEDETGVTISDDQQKGFFKLLERLSPKDSQGNIIHYADPSSTWELFQSSTVKKDSRAKDLASRSMVQSGASGTSGANDDAERKYLKEIGIL